MNTEQESRARAQEIHELRTELKQEIRDSQQGTNKHRELNRKLDALNEDNDAAHARWFTDLTTKFPL